MTIPTQNSTSPFAKASFLFKQNKFPQWRESVASGHESLSPDSSVLVKYLFSLITSPTLIYRLPTLGNDTEAFRKTVELLIEATKDGTLTENEADAVLRLLAGEFTARRFNRIFEQISNMDETNWFLATSRLSEHERR